VLPLKKINFTLLSNPLRTCQVQILFLALLFPLFASAQDSLSTTSPHTRKRLRLLTIGATSTYVVTLVGLNQLWYANEPQSSFHFFNDNHEWRQVDKAGHFFTAYHISRVGVEAFRWTGMPDRKAVLWGSLTGMLFQTPIEILDGFSAAYGASWGDLIANTAGSGLLLGQYWLWKEPRIHPKFSFSPTPLAKLRPNTLGDNILQQSLKDYNGQTYWLAFDIQPWLREGSRFPAWVNIALGYGAQNMIYAGAKDNQAQGFDTYRQYYLSLDINFTRIPTQSKFLKKAFFLLNALHVPAPALEFNRKQGFVFRPVYF
jgi:uncharacterized protein YfiM (DUF2279 family)